MAEARDTVDLVDSAGQIVTVPREVLKSACVLAQSAKTLELPETVFPSHNLEGFARHLKQALRQEGPEHLEDEPPEWAGALMKALLDLEATEAILFLATALEWKPRAH